jgi:hypothetical protein
MARNQNRSHAVMAQRYEPSNSLDDFPTPPWATRALVEHVLNGTEVSGLSCLEPACGRGHMASALKPYFGPVTASDIGSYGYGSRRDFFNYENHEQFDWIITNPPFRLAEEFFLHAYPSTKRGVALLVRTVFLESVGRLERVFSRFPPTTVAQFSERVPMVKGRLDRKASTATGYAWVVWCKPLGGETRLTWVPPCRKELERSSDYLPGFSEPKSCRPNIGAVRPIRSGDLFGYPVSDPPPE